MIFATTMPLQNEHNRKKPFLRRLEGFEDRMIIN